MQGRVNSRRAPKHAQYGYCEDCGHAVKLHVRPHLDGRGHPLGTCIQCEGDPRPICPFVVNMFKDAQNLKEVKDIGKKHKKDQKQIKSDEI